MKKSKYSLFIEKQGFVLGYNTFSNNFLGISKKAYSSFKTQNLEDFEKSFAKLYQNFIENGFIIPDTKSELDLIRYNHKNEAFASRDYMLIVYPTKDCNLRCWYCYEDLTPNSKMSQETQKRIIKNVESKLEQNRIDKLHVNFFGGEPLMYFDEIAYPLGIKLKKLLGKYSKEFSCNFITNGTLITENNIRKILELNPFLQITIDGSKEKHNTTRVPESKEPTYDKIINALTLIDKYNKSEEGIFHSGLTLRINYDNETLNGADQILEDISHIDKSKLTIHFERVWQTSSESEKQKHYELLKKTLNKYGNAGIRITHGIFGSRNVSCPSEKKEFAVVNYDGSLHRCNGRDISEKTEMGYLDENGEMKWDEEKLSQRLGNTTFENPMCINCQMLPICMGPCNQKCYDKEWNWKEYKNVCAKELLDHSVEENIVMMFENNLRMAKLIKNEQ